MLKREDGVGVGQRGRKESVLSDVCVPSVRRYVILCDVQMSVPSTPYCNPLAPLQKVM